MIAVRLLLPAVAGSLCVFGFAPFYAWPVPIAALAALFFAWTRCATPREAALAGYAFGLGYFLVGVSWVYVSLHDFGQMPLVLAALATFLFCAFLALFPALVGWLAGRNTVLATAFGLLALLLHLRSLTAKRRGCALRIRSVRLMTTA